MASPKYILVYTETFHRHLKLVEAKYHTLIRETLEEQLEHDPQVPTRNRKPLKKPIAFNAEWELRFGPKNRFRVFYSVVGQEVVLMAFGEKKGWPPDDRGRGGRVMKKATFETVQTRFGKYVEASVKQPIVIMRKGEPVALLVGISRNGHRKRKLRDILREAWQDYEEHGGVSHEQFWSDLAKETSAAKRKK